MSLRISKYVVIRLSCFTRQKQGPLDIASETNTVRAATLIVFNKSVDIGKIKKLLSTSKNRATHFMCRPALAWMIDHQTQKGFQDEITATVKFDSPALLISLRL